jgi:hypothetical protein
VIGRLTARNQKTCLFPELSIFPNYLILFLLLEHSHPDRRRSERLVGRHRRLRIGHKNSETRYETSAGNKLGCFVIMKNDMRYQELSTYLSYIVEIILATQIPKPDMRLPQVKSKVVLLL